MSTEISITTLFDDLVRGDQQAARRLWEHFYARLVELADKKLRSARKRVADEEDVVVSAFAAFCRAAQAGRYPNIDSRDSLWRLLIEITSNKALNQIREAQAKKRGGTVVRGESVFVGLDSSIVAGGLKNAVAAEPTPEFAESTALELQDLLAELAPIDDEKQTLRSVALLAMEEYTNQQIAKELQIGLRTVERKLQIIRKVWAAHAPRPRR